MKDILQESVSKFLNPEAAQSGAQAQSFHAHNHIQDVLNKGSICDAFDLSLFSNENRLSDVTADILDVI